MKLFGANNFYIFNGLKIVFGTAIFNGEDDTTRTDNCMNSASIKRGANTVNTHTHTHTVYTLGVDHIERELTCILEKKWADFHLASLPVSVIRAP